MKLLRRVVGVVMVLVVLGAGTAAGVAWSSGWRIYVVRTGSMAPNIRPGDVVVDVPAKAVKLGEVITFARTAGMYTTHRVVAVTSRGIQTKGDANPSPDYGYIRLSQVAGRVVAVVPKAGYVLEFLSHPKGLAALALFLVAAWLALGLLRPADRRGATEGCHAITPKHQVGAPEPVISLRESDLNSLSCPNGHSVSKGSVFCPICRAAVGTGDEALAGNSRGGPVLAAANWTSSASEGGPCPAQAPPWPDSSAAPSR